jgi:hypothetical protein
MLVAAESILEFYYLLVMFVMGIQILRNHRKPYLLFGIMCLITALGDGIYLIPKMIALTTSQSEGFNQVLGFGRFVHAVSLSVFYLLMVHFYRLLYRIKGGYVLLVLYYLLFALRIIMLLLPQNNWMRGGNTDLEIIRESALILMIFATAICFFVKKKKLHQMRFFWVALSLIIVIKIPMMLYGQDYKILEILNLPLGIITICMSYRVMVLSLKKMPQNALMLKKV